MGEVAAPDRERLLRSKKNDLNGIVASRKRKLRELYAICDNEGPIPQINLSNIDAPPTTPAENHFLEVSDILQARLFDESNLPTRRQLRSSTTKNRSPIRKSSPETRNNDVSRRSTKIQRDEATSRKGSAAPLGLKPDGVVLEEDVNRGQGLPMQRSTSKGSQTDLNVEATGVLDGQGQQATRKSTPQTSAQDNPTAPSNFETDRIRRVVESPPGSPGADPRKVLPITAEETAELPVTDDALGSNDVPHKAATVHLPPKEVQEARLLERKQARQHRDHAGHLSINLPKRDTRNDPVSSPGSTIGAHSATTPVLHEASTDTSPENDHNHYDAERLGHKEDDVQTPQELRPSPEEIAEKERHDRIQRAQIEVSRRQILGDAAALSEEQLRMGGIPGSRSSQSNRGSRASTERSEGRPNIDPLTKGADQVAEEVVGDQDEVDAVPTPEDDRMSGVEVSKTPQAHSTSKQQEVPDSDAETPADAMDVDGPTIKDSFESRAEVSLPTDVPAQEVVTDFKDSSTTTLKPPQVTPSTPAVAPSLERMTTRVSSGAIRPKPVSEILGQIAPPNTNGSSDRTAKGSGEADSAGTSTAASRSATPLSPRARSYIEKAKEKERSKLSTVIFPATSRPQTKPASNGTDLVPSQAAKDDYLTDLFISNAMADKRGVSSLENLIGSAHKTITTSNAFVPIIEHQTLKVLKRIYNLQSSHKWSLRQPKRSPEPIRPTTHWDVLLQEAKWMQTDFKEERKWKRAAARNLACACAAWVNEEESRPFLQIKAAPPKQRSLVDDSKDVDMQDSSDALLLEPSGDADMPLDDFDEEPQRSLLETVSPAAIFALQDDDIVFGLRMSPTTEKLLNELPMYGAPLIVPQSDLPTSELDPDRLWKRPALPLSKFIEGRLELKSEKPPRKKSRFEHEDEDDEDDPVVFGDPKTKHATLPPDSTEVALFNPEHKHIRDRIHSSHQFRPPSEFVMPQQSFFECRTASQWTWGEDDDLRAHVRKYSYNWSLISSLLASKSLFASGAERRTPWECFERWINLEGLPADMQKTAYFRAYTNRIEAANRLVMVQAAQAPQPAASNGQIQPPPRRRPTSSVRVERRRNQKHLTIVDAMRKLAKKRETSVQKQQHAAGLAAMRKANEVPQARGPLHTPQEFSRLKAEREEQMKERIMALQQRQEVQRRAALLQQRNAGQGAQQPGLPPNGGGPPQQRATAAGGQIPNAATANPGNQNLAVPGQNRPRQMPTQMPNAPMQNGLRAPPMTMNGVPPIPPMHGIQGQLPLPNPALDVGLVARAQNISEQQRQAIRMQQQGQLSGQTPQMHNSPPRMNGMPQPGFQIPNNMMPPFNTNPNGVGTPPSNSMINSPGQGQAGSPRMGQTQNSGSVAHIKALEQQFQARHPSATPEQITRMIHDHVSKQVHQQQQRQGIAQSAMNAAAGGNGMNINAAAVNMNAGQSGTTPQLYAQMLRQQQENQHKLSQQAAQQQGAHGGNGQNQGNGQVNGSHQGHAHRASSGSVQSGGK